MQFKKLGQSERQNMFVKNSNQMKEEIHVRKQIQAIRKQTFTFAKHIKLVEIKNVLFKQKHQQMKQLLRQNQSIY